MVNTPSKFYGYCRESIDLESGVQIQKEQITKMCELSGKVITKWYIDNDSSAYEFRPKYDKMMEAIRQDPEVGGIACSCLSRFGRSTVEVLTAHKLIKDLGKELVLAKENIDTSTPGGRLMFGMIAVFNDFEHDLIMERTKAGTEHAKKYGTKSGKPMHRPPIKIDWKKFDEYKAMNLSVPSIAKIFGITKKTMYKKIMERK